MPSSNQLRVLSLVGVVGLACSVSMAQKQVASRNLVAAEGAETTVRTLAPINVTRIVHVHSDGSLDATDQSVYSNGVFTTLPTSGYYSFNGVSHAIDEVGLQVGPSAGAGPGTTAVSVSVKKVTIGVATAATVGATETPDVQMTWYNTITPGTGTVTPVASGAVAAFRGTLGAPTGGWAPGTLYLFDIDLTVSPLAPFTISSDCGAAEIAFYTGTSGTTPASNFGVGFYGGGNTIGNSANTFYYDNNNDGIIAQSEAFVAVSNPTQGLRPKSSFVLSLIANVDSGSCCLPNGSCLLTNAASCTRALGTFGGIGSACGSCNQPGACVLADGSCVSAASAECTTMGGAFKGNGTNCSNDVCSGPTILFNNGPLDTGTTSSGGTASPADGHWSECQGVTACSNTTNGYSSGSNGPFRLADDFTVPAGETWTITAIDTFAYQTGSTSASSPFTTGNFNLQIWNGPPGTVAASTVVYGDTSTNRLTASTFAALYKIFFNQPGSTRPIYKNTLTLSPPAVLTAGTYWLDWQTAASNGAAHFSPPVTTKGFRGLPGRNALQNVPANTGYDWVPAEETGSVINCGTGYERIEFPFVVRGSKTGSGPGCGAACYANCDNSTSPPILNANDFQCFLNKYAAQDPTANCDGSTSPPVLNANDFQCFLNKYAAGCT